jgi:hypothetical protein
MTLPLKPCLAYKLALRVLLHFRWVATVIVMFLLSPVRPFPDAKCAFGVSPRKVLPMATTQQTLSQLDQARETEQNHAQASVTIQDGTSPFQSDHAMEQKRIADGIIETVPASKQKPYQFVYPSWPTSKPGPQITFPPAGQKPHPMRTDQMVYIESYDQEHGRPSVSPPPTPIVRANRTRTYIPELSTQEGTFDDEAMERWLDDGGNACGTRMKC